MVPLTNGRSGWESGGGSRADTRLEEHASRCQGVPNLSSERARARAASVSRSRGLAVVTREAIRLPAAAEISATACSKAAWLIFEGALNPLNFRTNWSEASRISASVAGGSKLKSVFIFLHTTSPTVWLAG